MDVVPLCSLYHRYAWGKSAENDEILFRPVPLPRTSAPVPPVEVVLMHVDGADIFLGHQNKLHVQTNAHVRVPKIVLVVKDSCSLIVALLT